MKCLHCGDCCKRASPLSAPEPCPMIIEDGNFIFCADYENRPEECIDHTFHGARFCPIGHAKACTIHSFGIGERHIQKRVEQKQ